MIKLMEERLNGVTNNFTVLINIIYSCIFAVINELNPHLIIRHNV